MGICILFTKSQQNLELVDLEMVEQDLDLEMVEKVQEHQDVHVYPRVWEGQDPHLLLDQDQVPHLLLDQDQVQPLLEVDQGQDQGQEKLQSPSQDQDLDQWMLVRCWRTGELLPSSLQSPMMSLQARKFFRNSRMK